MCGTGTESCLRNTGVKRASADLNPRGSVPPAESHNQGVGRSGVQRLGPHLHRAFLRAGHPGIGEDQMSGFF